jgi:hypothetical protein
MWSAGPGDDQARFLADLRALRDVAAIGYDELAARAHYPSDVLKEAENGPLLPGLPVLTAYVRACDGDVLDWEERWRRLAAEGLEDPDLPIRPPGASPAAVAGARAGVGVTPPDVYDPERIRAALRGGSQGRSDGGRRTDRAFSASDWASSASDGGSSAPNGGSSAPNGGSDFSDLSVSPAGWGGDASQESGARRDTRSSLDTDTGAGWNAQPSWDAVADQTIPTTNGNHSVRHREPFDAAVAEVPGPDDRTVPTGQFRWLPDTTSASGGVDTEFAWPDEANAEPAAPQADDDDPLTEPAAGEWAPAEATAGEWAPAKATAGERAPWQQDHAWRPSERSDFWTTPATAASADLQPTATPPRGTEEQPLTRASWPGSAETAGISAEPAVSELHKQPPVDTAASTKATQLVTSAERAGSTGSAQAVAAHPRDRQKDHFFPVRLLVIIVIAALIGSALVLLLS